MSTCVVAFVAFVQYSFVQVAFALVTVAPAAFVQVAFALVVLAQVLFSYDLLAQSPFALASFASLRLVVTALLSVVIMFPFASTI